MRAISKRTVSFSVAIAVFALIGAGCHQSNNSSSSSSSAAADDVIADAEDDAVELEELELFDW